MEVPIYVAIIGAVVAVTATAIRLWPALADAVLSDQATHQKALTGTRGILALSVMTHHLIPRHLVAGTAAPEFLASHHFLNQLGSASAAVFFMISAYLFGGRLLSNGGQLRLGSFAFGRVMRIVPLYLFAVLAVCLICTAFQGFRFVEPPAVLLSEAGRNLLFAFVPLSNFNGIAAPEMLGQVWTLRYEWLLYAAIPVMALLYRRTGWVVVLYIPLLALVRLFHDGRFYFFVAGLACAQLARFDGRRQALFWAAVAPLALVALIVAYPDSHTWPQALLLMPLLVTILIGRHWAAWLGSRPLRFLGEISFSVYLMQGAVMGVLAPLLGIDPHRLGHLGFVAYAIVICLCNVAFSVVTFLLVEKRFMHVKIVGRRPVLRRHPSGGLPSDRPYQAVTARS